MKSTSYMAKQPDSSGYIHYSEQEHAVWEKLMHSQLPGIEAHMSAYYKEGLKTLELPVDRIPQCQEITEVLQPLTGWCVEPVPALIGFKTFFTMLSECRFPAASFIRRDEHFDYIQEPDIFHEVLGHTPLLTHQALADFSQKLGEAGLQVDQSEYAWLIRLYWFTIEFGLIKEGEQVKGLGSGLASSVSELEHAMGPKPVLKPFDPMEILRTSYRIDIPQPLYYVLDDLNELLGVLDRDLCTDVKIAKTKGILPPLYPLKEKQPA